MSVWDYSYICQAYLGFTIRWNEGAWFIIIQVQYFTCKEAPWRQITDTQTPTPFCSVSWDVQYLLFRQLTEIGVLPTVESQCRWTNYIYLVLIVTHLSAIWLNRLIKLPCWYISRALKDKKEKGTKRETATEAVSWILTLRTFWQNVYID